jgi:hypothetical protein
MMALEQDQKLFAIDRIRVGPHSDQLPQSLSGIPILLDRLEFPNPPTRRTARLLPPPT